MTRIGCIGLGAMGLPTARHLARSFGPVAAYDPAADDSVQGDSLLRLMPSAADVGRSAELIFICLPGEKASRAVADALMPEARAGLTVVELSTLDPELVREIGARYAALGAAFCDAPVFGTPANAREGKLAVVVSGSAAAYNTVRPAIEGFARRVSHAGDLGTASLIKVMQNSLGLVQLTAIAEAFEVFEAAGGNPHVFYDAVVGSGGMSDSPLFAKIGIDFADHHARFDALLRIGVKDIGLGHRVAQRTGVPAALIAHANAQFAAAAEDGFGEADLLSVSRVIRRSAQVTD
ncbi:MAG: NAD(P)-dependent oxidoreductase [Betaproteobacteria bacterium]